MRSDSGHQTSYKIKNYDSSDQESDFNDLFSERAKIEKCFERIPFNKLFKVSDKSLLCNLKSIVTDEMISACAKVGQNRKNGQIESEIDSCQSAYATATCVASQMHDLGYKRSECSVAQVWAKLQEMAPRDLSGLLRDSHESAFSVAQCGEIEEAQSGKHLIDEQNRQNSHQQPNCNWNLA